MEFYEPKKINLADWDLFGGGHTAESYYHKTDDTVMMKLYAPFVPKETVYWEKECADAVMACGVATTAVRDVVIAEDGRLGVTFDRLKNKKSISRLVADDPDNLDEYVRIFAEETKLLHERACNKHKFPSKAELVRNLVTEATALTEERRKKLLDFLAAVPETGTCIQGDLHIGNLLIADGKRVWIDLADWAWGNPLYDIGVMYTMMVIDTGAADDFHCDSPTLNRVWRTFVRYYAGAETEEQIDAYTKSIEPFALPRLLFFIKVNPSAIDIFGDRINNIIDGM